MTATKTRGRYAAPRKTRNPFYVLAALATGLLLLVGACADTDDGAPDSFPVNAERRSDPTSEPRPVETEEPKPEPEPVTEAPKPEPTEESDSAIDNATVGEFNAMMTALTYLDLTGFSESGLIGQLEFEGYTAAEIEFAMSQISPNWKAEAVESAESYLELTSFSRSGLIDQLLFEGFTQAQAEHAVNQVGL